MFVKTTKDLAQTSISDILLIEFLISFFFKWKYNTIIWKMTVKWAMGQNHGNALHFTCAIDRERFYKITDTRSNGMMCADSYLITITMFDVYFTWMQLG